MAVNNIYALDIGSWSLKVARGWREKDGEIVVDMYEEIRYRHNEKTGEGEPPAGIQGALEDFSKKHALEVSDDLCVSISGSHVFSRFIKLPPVPDSVDKIIQYEARQQIPFNMDEVVWDYQPVKDEHEPWEEVDVGLFAVRNEKIEELMDLLAPWRRNLRMIQQAPLAIYNFLSFEGYDSEPVVAVDVGEECTDMVIIDPPGYWLRSLRVGGGAITERIASHFGVPHREAERIKARVGAGKRAPQLLRVVGKPVGDILGEIQRSLGYYKSQAPEKTFNKIIGIGNTFRLRGLDKVISEGLQTEVTVLNQVKNITLTEDAKASIGKGICGCATLFGLITQRAGETPIKVNLVPDAIISENEMQTKKPYLAGAAAGVLALVGLLTLGQFIYGRQVAAQLDLGEGVADQVQDINRRYSNQRSEADSLEQELSHITERGAPVDIFQRVLSEITRAVPEDAIPEQDSLLPPGLYIENIQFRWVQKNDYERHIADVENLEGLVDLEEADGGSVACEDAVLVVEINYECSAVFYDSFSAEIESPRELDDGSVVIETETVTHYEYDEEKTREFYDELIEEFFRERTYTDTDTNVFRDVYRVGELEREEEELDENGNASNHDSKPAGKIRFVLLGGIEKPQDNPD